MAGLRHELSAKQIGGGGGGGSQSVLVHWTCDLSFIIWPNQDGHNCRPLGDDC